MAPNTIQRVALVGRGFLGTSILEQLIKAGFSVTVVTRSLASLEHLPPIVEAAEADYNSLSSLVSAFKGHDAVIVAVNSGAIGGQKVMIDAAVQAEVSRFIPSDFGTMTTDPAAQTLPVHALLLDIQNYLKEKADKGEIEWTIFSSGAFLDLVIKMVPVVCDVANKEIVWYDAGDVKTSTTTTATIGKAIAAALKIPLETKNRNLFIHDAVLTQKEMVARVKKHVPGEWKETQVSSEEELKATLEAVERGEFAMPTMMRMLKAAIWSGKYRSAYDKVDNEMLGLGLFSDEDLETEFEKRLK
ncbi:Nn.00g112580.m01.CDS01 [Neocucurbitaria sp. VM-36]